MDELKTTHAIVLDVLENHVEARNSDGYLCYMVYKMIGKKKGIDVENIMMPMFFLRMKELGFPSTETVRRTRQKIQATRPDLSCSERVDDFRKIKEQVFFKYAQGEI